jgi:cell wall-associated NlpC family hydrolase
MVKYIQNLQILKSQYTPSKILILAILVCIVSACSSSTRFSSEATDSRKIYSDKAGEKNEKTHAPKREKPDFTDQNVNSKRKSVYKEAEKWLGTPYVWGGESKSGADCSGFVMEVYKKVGVKLPRTAAEQYEYGKSIDIRNAEMGDLIFFRKSDKISHVGIYLGANFFIHASSSSGVIVQDLTTFGSTPVYAGCRKILK